MKTKIFLLFIAALAIAALVWSLSVQQSANQLYQSGMYKEDIEGKLEEAIAVYREIIKKFPQDGPVAAKALFHMGLCYEKLGNREAQTAYQRLIKDYPGQKEEVALARERLAALTKAQPSADEMPKFTKIEFTTPLNTDNALSPATLSPDGQHLAFISRKSVWTVAIHGELHQDVAGPQVRLTKTLMQAWGQPSWSQDGSRIAFNAIVDSTIGFPSRHIYDVPAEGGEPRRIPIDRIKTTAHFFTLSLSPDAQYIAYASSEIRSEDQVAYLYIASTDNGETRQFIDEPAMQPAFSPDGKKLAYLTVNRTVNSVTTAGTFQTALWIRPIDGSMPIQVSSTAHSPVWSPDGRFIAFFPEHYFREPMRMLHVVPLDGQGRPTAPATAFQLPFQSIDSLAGWSVDNEIGILAYSAPQEAIFAVPASGGRAVRVSPLPARDERQFASIPRWSPDGKRIYFRYVPPDATSSQDLQIAYIPAGGGEIVGIPIDPLPMEAMPGGGNDISPDGKRIAFAGYTTENDVNIYVVPAEGGEPVALTSQGGSFPSWSPDGRTIAFATVDDRQGPDPQAHIYTVPAQGGEVSRMTSELDQVLFSTVAWSPDGSQIAYFGKDRTLRIISRDGGTSRILARLERDTEKPPLGLWDLRHCDMAWSSNGKEVAYAMNGKLWVVAIANGQPRLIATGLGKWNVTGLDWSPDGRAIAFTGSSGDDRDLWLMSDFLPLVRR